MTTETTHPRVAGPGATATRPPRRELAQSAWAATRPVRPVVIGLIALLVILSVTQPAFATVDNIENALTAAAVLWIVAMGMTLVLLSAGFDLSVGAIAALCGFMMAKLLESGMPGWAALVITLVAGFGIGALINGTLVGWLKLSVFVVTLGTLTALTGVLSLWSATQSVYVTNPLVTGIASGRWLGVPILIWIMLVSLLIVLYVQSRTYFGRDIYAIGGSTTAARLSGVRVPLVLMMIYGISGLCAAVGGVIVSGQVGAATPQVDGTLALQAIAAVLIGGTILTGGAGGVVGTALGVLFIGFLDNGLSIAGVQSFWQQVITGIILILAVTGDRISAGGMRRGVANLRRRPPAPGASV